MKKTLSLIIAASIICMIMAIPCLANESSFTDVRGTEYFADAAETLNKLGFIKGYEDGSFRPEKHVTRAEMAAIICRYIGQEDRAERNKGYTTDFTQDMAANHWASGFVITAIENDIILGDGNGNFRPEDNVRYEEAVKMVTCASGMKDFIRKNDSDWAAPYITVADDWGILDNVKSNRGDYMTRGDIAVMIDNARENNINGPLPTLFGGEYTGIKYTEIEYNTLHHRTDAEIYYSTEFDKDYNPIWIKYNGTPIEISKSTDLRTVAKKNGIDVTAVQITQYRIKAADNNDDSSTKPKADRKHQLTVTMTGCGAIRITSGKYEAGANVPLYVSSGAEANFIEWTTTAGTIIDPTSPTTLITMPDEDVTVCAVFSNGIPSTKPSNNKTYYEEDEPEISVTEFEDEVIRLVNIEREKNGLAALKNDKTLRNVAAAHSKDMADRNFFDHENPDGESPFDRMKNNGIRYGYAGENIAKGQRTAESVVNSWMNSEGHRKNILNGNFKRIGVGLDVSSGTYIWTQCFTD